MKRWLLTLSWTVALAVAPTADSAQFKIVTHTFTVPDGFEVELVAGPPLVNRPIEADFDELGRLYVTDSSGSNDKSDKQLIDRPHRVVRLEDTDGDGRFDKSVVFADKMMFPEGCLWYDGSLYVAAPPSIWRLTDTDGDGVADKREEWFQGKTLTGCANDLHGPYLGPDGWIYWCKGAFAKQTNTLPNGKPFISRAAHIFRARPDSTGLEPVMTGGMDNPVGLAWSPEGELFFTSTFIDFTQPGNRDGIGHAIYGSVFGKVNSATDDHKKTGELMPVMTQLGAAAPCGLARYESRVFGEEYQNNLFACLFNMHKVTRHVLEPIGATFKTRDSDFLVSDNTDFHPTDVLEDADGSLLVIDTGGWYKLCCPTSQLAKPDVLGAIYRIRRKGAPKVVDPRGLKLAWSTLKTGELIKLLDDSRPAVVKRAIAALARDHADAVGAIASGLHPDAPKEQRLSEPAARNALWALARMGGEAAREVGRFGLRPSQPQSVIQTELATAALLHDKSAARWGAPEILFSTNQPLRRAAVTLLGRTGFGAQAISAASTQNDRALEHAIIYAMIESGENEKVLTGLDSANVSGRRAALIALDQMDGGGLTSEQVTPLLASTNGTLKQTAVWIVGHHPEWGGAMAGYFRQRLQLAASLSGAERAELVRQLAQFSRDKAIQDLLTANLRASTTTKEARLIVLRAMAQAASKDAPPAWASRLAQVIGSGDTDLIRQAVATARALSPSKDAAPELTEALLSVARSSEAAEPLRLEALAAVPGGLGEVDEATFDLLRACVAPTKPVTTRSAAAGVLAKARLSEEQLLALADALKTAGPLEVPKLLGAFERATNEALGLKLVAVLKESPALSSLRAEMVKPRLTNFPATVRQEADALLASLNSDGAKQRAHLEELLAGVKGGDIRRGQAIFNSAKAACAACHAIGYLGGKVGPDLTTIGQIRTERDLLESIVYPSASFVRSYEPMIVATKSGDEFSGVLRKDGADEVVLATGPETEVRIARADISEMRPGTVSVMPQGLDEQLSRQELADLVAFLKGTKWGAQ
ncbi:MAG TPA: PVC-type heme-binding CxxCH protein [Verrucomicrobiae bacterium]